MGSNRVKTRIVQVLGIAFFLSACTGDPGSVPPASPDGLVEAEGWTATNPLRDLSGLAWVEGDVFVTVHDVKSADYPRVTLVQTPTAHGGLRVRHLPVAWPEAEGGMSHDLESVTRIPGTDQYILAESGDNNRGPQRLFRVSISLDGGLTLLETVPWPVSVFNVEATAVADVDGALYFLYAERSQGERTTLLRWAPMTLDPLTFGDFEEVRVGPPSDEGMNRPIVDLAVAMDGTIYAAASYDPDVDTGPYTSGVFEVGVIRVRTEGSGGAEIVLTPRPRWTALTNGLKIEGLAIREGPDHPRALFYGTDDEYYGGILRPVWTP
jgi:hypothetical protein